MHYFSLLRQVVIQEAVLYLLRRLNRGFKNMNLLNLPNKIISDYPLLPLFDYVLNVVFGKRGQVGHVQYIKPVPHLCPFYNDM